MGLCRDEGGHGESDGQVLRDQKDAGTVMLLNEFPKVFGHGLKIVGNQDPSVSSGASEHFGI